MRTTMSAGLLASAVLPAATGILLVACTGGEPKGGQRGTEVSVSQADLLAALDDEYKAIATYAQVIADFGDVRPFSSIVESERRHADAVIRLLQRHGVDVPPNTWPDRVPRYGSLQEACEAAVSAEIETGALYERLLAGTSRSDLLAVYRHLQEASQQRHLPAFRRCAERESSAQ
jgi:hypothetical protein